MSVLEQQVCMPLALCLPFSIWNYYCLQDAKNVGDPLERPHSFLSSGEKFTFFQLPLHCHFPLSYQEIQSISSCESICVASRIPCTWDHTFHQHFRNTNCYNKILGDWFWLWKSKHPDSASPLATYHLNTQIHASFTAMLPPKKSQHGKKRAKFISWITADPTCRFLLDNTIWKDKTDSH